MSLKKQAASGFIWAFVQQFSVQAVNFSISILMARLLLPFEFGLMGMIYVFFTIGNVLLDAGLSQSLIRTIDVDQEDYSTVFYFNIFLGFFLYIILYISSPFIAEFYNQPILSSLIRVYSIFFILGSFTTVQNAILVKQMKFKKLMSISIPATIIGGVSGVLFAYSGFGVWSLVFSTLITTFLNGLLLWIFSSWQPKLIFNKEKFKKHFNFGYKLSLTNLIDAVFGNIYQIVLGRFYTPRIVGYFARSESMKQIAVYSVSTTLTKVTFPLLANIQDDRERLSVVYRKILQAVIFSTTPVLFILTVLAKPLFIFLFTEKWVEAVPYFQMICMGALLMPINNYNINLFSIIGRSDIILKLEIIEKPILVILVIVAIPFGIMPLLGTQIIYAIICFFINVAYSKKVLNYSHLEQISDIVSVLILNICIAFIVYVCNQFMVSQNISNIVQIIIGIFIFTFIYLSAAYFFKMKGFLNIVEILKR